jgi:hypothetical protein
VALAELARLITASYVSFEQRARLDCQN